MRDQAYPNRSSWRRALWGVIAAILLLPLFAMQVTDAVNWTAFDFAVAALLLVGAGACYEIVTRKVQGKGARLLIGAVLVVVVSLIWAHGAVGIF